MWKLILVLIIGSLAVDWCAFLAMKEPMVYREDKFEQIILADGKYVSTPRNSGYFSFKMTKHSYPGFPFVCRIQNPDFKVAFFCLDIVQTSRPFVQSLLKFPM